MRRLATAQHLAEEAVRVVALSTQCVSAGGDWVWLWVCVRGGLRHPCLLLRCSSLGANRQRMEANCDEEMTTAAVGRAIVRWRGFGDDTAARGAYLAPAQ